MGSRWMTGGEQLFFTIRDHALQSAGFSSETWSNLSGCLRDIGGSEHFPAYLKGAVTVHAMLRLFYFWKDEKVNIAAESTNVKKMSSFISAEMFPSLSRDLVTRLARLVISAVDSSDRPIKPSTRKTVLLSAKDSRCYICSQDLDPRANEKDDTFLTLEHIWPSSLGGDSTEENLLPACKYCQSAKAAAISWEWLDVQNWVISSSPSDDALKSIPKRVRIARHYLRVIQHCEEEKLSLKAGFLAIGPFAKLTYRNTTRPITFFDLQTHDR